MEVESLSAENVIIEAELAELNGLRSTIATDVPPQAMVTYRALLERREGRAVALVERGVCEGCRLTLPTGELSRVRSEEGIHQCSSCSRILFSP